MERFSLTEEQAFALAQEGSPAFIPGAFQIAVAQFKAIPKMAQAMRTGLGIGWHEHDAAFFHGTERFFRPGYAANLVSQRLPSLEGVDAALKRGARVADVGCGHGASTILMAQAYPNSTFVGFDYHAPSVDHAWARAQEAGLGKDRVRFEVASAKDFPGENYDLVAMFDCLHDMGDPAGAAAHIRTRLKPDGTWMIVEPIASDSVSENVANPVSRLYYNASTMICVSTSLAQEVGQALGAQAGEKRLTEILAGAGFTRIRRATEGPFNMVLEVRA